MVTIHPLPAADAATLLPLLNQVHNLHVAHQPHLYAANPDATATEAWLTKWLSNPAVAALIARPEGGGAAIGYVIFELQTPAASPLKPAEQRGMLHHICVDAGSRRRGIGNMLIRAMRRDLRRSGAVRVATSYAVFNRASAGLMASCGLTPVMTFAEGPV